MVVYESPFHETMRTMLRLERLFDRLGVLLARDDALDHHFALATMFEALDVSARADLKSELLKDLDRQRGALAVLRDNPHVAQDALDALLARMDGAFEALNRQSGKAGQSLGTHEWLSAVRSRLAIPGGAFEFDVPAYHAWLQNDAPRRRADLSQWATTLAPLADALRVLLQLVRQTAQPARVVARGGVFQQSLGGTRPPQLLRLRADVSPDLVPEITGHRLLVGVRWMRADAEGRLRPAAVDVDFELALCH